MEPEESRPFLDGIPFKSITVEMSAEIERPFTKNEIREAISKCGVDKSTECFCAERQFLDGVLVANEVVDYARKEGKNGLLFKVDFEKAYDKVNWNFLRYMMNSMGFGRRWLLWMDLLVFNSNMSVPVNRSPTKEFGVGRGLRQGDPLSPFLFVLVTGGFSGIVGRSIEVGEFCRFDMKRSCWVDLLQFADDTLIVGEGTWKHVWAIKEILRAFEIVSGLGINYHKSKLIGINAQYGDLSSLVYSEGNCTKYSSFSNWWRDIVYIGNFFSRDPIVKCYLFYVHNGYTTPFWESCWLSEEALKNVFPELFEASCLKGVSVGPKGRNGADAVSWTFGIDTTFTVASCYQFNLMDFIPYGPVNKHDEAFGILWKAEVPFKIKAFGWRLFLDRLPTKELLMYRGIPISLDNLKCVFCGFCVENRNHSFLRVIW
ncbi:uncharacterized protein LOC131641483 [Vicia villosa]|uniref:uncharacterized protein LOC131641483 n=1 Tax=Vicia villosa TaxID=3911 RepID=UPI00273CE7EF|nr:uncharacterized protein LOC131641483 [Vicia villosa]